MFNNFIKESIVEKIIIKSYQVKGGDCFLIKFMGTNILVDTGYKTTSSMLITDLKEMKRKNEPIDLLIITHIDNDHIGGALSILTSKEITEIKDVWYNGYLQVFEIEDELVKLGTRDDVRLKSIIASNTPIDEENSSGEIGYSEAESFEELLYSNKILINQAFQGKVIKSGMSYSMEKGDIDFRFLTPSEDSLEGLKSDWTDVLISNGLYNSERNIAKMSKAFEFYYLNTEDESEFNYEMASQMCSKDLEDIALNEYRSDDSVINKSSISFIMRIKNKNLMFLGDSNPECVLKELKRLLMEDEKYKEIEVLKVSHHGSKYNTNNELLSHLDVNTFLISTNGSPKKNEIPSKPHIETIAKLIFHQPDSKLIMNHPKENYNEDLLSLIEQWNKSGKSNVQISFGDTNEPLVLEIEVEK